MKKIIPIIVLSLIVCLVFSLVAIKNKNNTIQVQAQDLLVNEVVKRIYEDNETIKLLKEKKFMDCEVLGLDIPLKLIEDGICPVPSM